MKTCLRRLSCNFCFIILATFSKTKIANAMPLGGIKISTTLTNISNSNIIDPKLNKVEPKKTAAKKIYYNKEVFAPLPKKRKKIAKPVVFKVKGLPNGEYTQQENNDGAISIKKKIMIFK
jgi:hypothetical protein